MCVFQYHMDKYYYFAEEIYIYINTISKKARNLNTAKSECRVKNAFVYKAKTICTTVKKCTTVIHYYQCKQPQYAYYSYNKSLYVTVR